METGFQLIDFIIVIFYLGIVAVVGSLSGGKQESTNDYFLGGKDIPWWAVSFSVVAAETSTLTFISIPGIAYVTNLNFLQLTLGYLIGRIIISFLFLPAYKKGNLTTAYGLLKTRFGKETRSYASIVFLFTRVAADGVRLFATSIPLALIFKSFSLFQGFSNLQIYIISIIVISGITLLYTYSGGLKGIVWVDVLQMCIYIGGAIAALVILFQKVPGGLAVVGEYAEGVNKLEIINLDFGEGIKGFFQTPYTLVGSILGGALLSMATHGTDQLIVQRLLGTRNLKDSKKALITSGVIIIFQFGLFLLVGLMLFAFYKGAAPGSESIPFHQADEIFPYFIIYELPAGLKGIIIAGLFAAAMSTMAGSISSLSSSAMTDLYKPYFAENINKERELKLSRLFTVLWTLVLAGVAMLFINVLESVVELALGISSITYGGLLGTFLLGALFKKTNQKAAIWGFSAGILVMLLLISVPFVLGKPPLVHYTWYIFIGGSITIIVGNLVSYIDKR